MGELMVVGRIRSPYGLQGWVWMDSFTEDPKSLFDWKPWTLMRRVETSSDRPAISGIEVYPEMWKSRGKGFIVRLGGHSERSDIELLVNCFIGVDESFLPALESNEFYWRDLEGCQVVTTYDRRLGVVKTVMATGANDVLIVSGDLESVDQAERLIPFTSQVVVDVNVKARLIRVDWDPEF